MTDKPENPPAFPHSCNVDYASKQGIPLGMTLRDYFAAAALHGIIACPAPIRGEDRSREKHADLAYAFADAMLKARQS